MSSRRHGVKSVYTALRGVLKFFALFILFIVAVVGWRKLWVEDRALLSLERGELISLGILLLIAGGLWLFARKVEREIDKA